jgi:CHAT domain-containing protein
MSDGALLDEVIGFPSALLQNGIGGVVSSQSVVDDDAAMLLVLRFFARLRSGVLPARALAEAQAWLRCATNDEIHHAFPKAYPVPAHRAGDALASWSERQRFTDPHNWAAFIYSGH